MHTFRPPEETQVDEGTDKETNAPEDGTSVDGL
jgi:hypothetical protein